jgi:hypothetical protein
MVRRGAVGDITRRGLANGAALRRAMANVRSSVGVGSASISYDGEGAECEATALAGKRGAFGFGRCFGSW